MSEGSTYTKKTMGTIWLPTLLCASCGSLLAIVLTLLGLLMPWKVAFQQFVVDGKFYDGESHFVQAEVEWVVCVVLSLALCASLLDSAGILRRLFILLAASTLLIGACFSMALWGMTFSPVAVLIAVVVSSICAVVYASQHTMPCEQFAVTVPQGNAEVTGQNSEIAEEEADALVEAVDVACSVEDEAEKIVKSNEKTEAKTITDTEVVSLDDSTDHQELEKSYSVPKPNIGKAQKTEGKVPVKGGKRG